MLNPLEAFLFLTFVLYSLLYKPLLALTYLLLLALFSCFSLRTSLPSSYYLKSKYSYSGGALLSFLGPNQSYFYMRCKYDITDTLKALKEWNQQSEVKLTITHVALKALAQALRSSESMNGRLAFGNVRKDMRLVQD